MPQSRLDTLVAKAVHSPAGFSLHGKKALVIGGNKGLGQAMSLALAAAGADVCVAGRGPAGLAETAAAITGMGRTGLGLPVDATSEEQVAALVAETLAAFGAIDILINSQGTVHLEPAADFDLEAWQRVMDTNLKSVVITCQQVGRHMLSRGYGKILLISSVRGFQGRAGDLAYAPSKGAIHQLTRSLAIEWGPKGITVNAIAPSFFRTEISRPILDDPVKREWVYSRSPMGRIGELEDMFGPAVFLVSDASAFVNGHVLLVDGGWTVA
ncbi:MAG: SDR family oxidoreductase [Planctomycetes bacterium]|nr:SDR family oxidoreductase [Planctomycetota bacterium]